MTFKQLQETFRQEFGITKLADIARELAVTPQVVSNWKSKNQLPYKYVKKLNKNVLLLGSGWQNKFCLEDTICAGAIADQLLSSNNFISESDSSVAAKYLYKSARDNYFGYLKASSHRKRLKKLNLNRDIKYCLTPNQTNVVPTREDNYLILSTS